MELSRTQIISILPYVAVGAVNFLDMPADVVKAVLDSHDGQYYYELCITWARIQDTIEPYAATGYDKDASRNFVNLEDRVLYMLSFLTSRKMGDDPTISPRSETIDPENENNIDTPLDPDKLARVKKLMEGYTI